MLFFSHKNTLFASKLSIFHSKFHTKNTKNQIERVKTCQNIEKIRFFARLNSACSTEGLQLQAVYPSENVIINIQIFHLTYLPSDQFNVVRQSGIPSRTSMVFSWIDFSEPVYTAVPRRFEVTVPSATDLMFEITTAAYQAQGFTPGRISTTLLNSERVWQDQNAPNFGEGPR